MTVPESESDSSQSQSLQQFLSLQSRLEESSYQFVNGDDFALLRNHGPWRKGQAVWVCKSQGRQRTPELFLRARIVHDNNDNNNDDDNDNNRILVQYPGGSTYRVRREMLVPILEGASSSQQVEPTTNNTITAQESSSSLSSLLWNKKCSWIVVYPETNDYRRACVTHTDPNENFCEIGCAQGITCHRVQQQQSSHNNSNNNNDVQRTVVGIDKSESSIAIARQRYPECHFYLTDVLNRNTDAFAETTTGDDGGTTMPPPPHVLAVDIGGNRDLDPVLQTLERVLTQWQPRLVLVKSRALHHCIRQVQQMNQDGTSKENALGKDGF